MNIKEILGDAYKEDMTVEDVAKVFEGINLIDPDTLPKSVKKEVFDKTASELAATKKRLEELEKTSMTDAEKTQKLLDDAEKAKLEYLKKSTKLDVVKVLVDGGLSEKDYKDIVDNLVSDNAEASVALANNFVGIIKSQKEATEKAVKAELLKNTPTPPKGADPNNAQKPDFGKMSVVEIDKYFNEHPEEVPKN